MTDDPGVLEVITITRATMFGGEAREAGDVCQVDDNSRLRAALLVRRGKAVVGSVKPAPAVEAV
jgi:hypothetical protein